MIRVLKMNIEDFLQFFAGVIIVICFGIAFFVFETSFELAITVVLVSIVLGLILFALAKIINLLEDIEDEILEKLSK